MWIFNRFFDWRKVAALSIALMFVVYWVGFWVGAHKPLPVAPPSSGALTV